jgi:cbb3-type cytochrome oxidase subunit 3
MDQTMQLVLVFAFAIIGILAVLVILGRDRRSAADVAKESPFAASTEGMKRCPYCGTGNLVTDSNCSNCGKKLPG